MPHLTKDEEVKESEQQPNEYHQFVESHGTQLIASGVPDYYWPKLFEKLSKETFDAGEYFKILCVQTEDGNKWKVVTIKSLESKHPNSIFLVDHAWTYRVSDCRPQLEQIPGLLERMAALMDIQSEERTKEEVIEDILQQMWKFNQTYSIGNAEFGSDESMPIWYIMDEFGSRVQHSDSPTVKMCPFYFAPLQISFTLMWPLKDLEENEEVTRDYTPNVQNPEARKARLIPWVSADLTAVDYSQKEPDISFFQSFIKLESMPDPNHKFSGLPRDRNPKVYLKYMNFHQFLTDKRFDIVETKEEADIIFIQKHFKEYDKYPDKCVNQFPFERVITVKDLLAVVCRRAGDGKEDPDTLERNPKWLPVTYNLETEITQFVSYFQHREKKALNNHWICKPWNLARGLDMHITDNLIYILRLPDSGPKIACKYVHDPVLFMREDIGNVKFDVRYIVLLSSVAPLKLYVYRVFWLRFANRPFSLDHFDEYEKHFTVMNYVEDGQKLNQVNYDDFIPMFESQYPAYKWADVEEDIFQMFREVFQTATALPSPQGITPCPQSRAMYAIDLLLEWRKNSKGERTIQPVICEVNFCPDCDRACKYHPNFVNDIFSTLFMDDIEGRPVTKL
ncbi:tubulin--tyrosine ligase-like protein 12 [Saccostrea echinata]|uniref:tubulin--tyrosine ligase-like protein 12 n=1 Tax=Saccostrea echinata TaxID=191078 RepID=UPI002A838488|nr:tubulin--tyrosine ligase-like protein 12 [Saccostrea echinata]